MSDHHIYYRITFCEEGYEDTFDPDGRNRTIFDTCDKNPHTATLGGSMLVKDGTEFYNKITDDYDAVVDDEKTAEHYVLSLYLGGVTNLMPIPKGASRNRLKTSIYIYEKDYTGIGDKDAWYPGRGLYR